MKRLQRASVLAALAVVVSAPWTIRARDVQGRPQPEPQVISSLTEPGESLEVVQASPAGYAAFAATKGRGLLLPGDGDTAADRAAAFVDRYGHRFGLADRSRVRLVKTPRRDTLGMEHVTLQQWHDGVPVTGAELLVHVRGPRVVAANGRVLDRFPADMLPALPADAARAVARQVVSRVRLESALTAQYRQPRLEVFNRGFLEHRSPTPSRLAWFVEATGPALREFIWIDAVTGALLLNFSQLGKAQNRQVYDASSTADIPGVLARSEGDPPVGDTDVNAAYDLSGAAYDYFFSKHGRDGLDGAGGAIVSTVNWFDPFRCPTSFWTGTQAVFCAIQAQADDIVGHELTHGVIESEANLFSFTESGALRESFADIFGETIDIQQNVTAEDISEVRWLIGEDVMPGGMRNLMDPASLGHPSHTTDYNHFWCSLSSINSGGVHHNSTVPSHAYALMVDGGAFNGYAVQGIGLDKAARIQYRALTTYLATSSGFIDAFNAVKQSCSDLVGTGGITHDDCGEVERALLAVELNAPWGCEDFQFIAPVAPAMCPSGGVPVMALNEGFEAASPAWTAASTTSAQWGVQTFHVESGAQAAGGPSPGSVSDHSYAMTASLPPLAAGSRAMFSHTEDFDLHQNGGLIEYSSDGGTTWLDPRLLVDGGVLPVDQLPPGNPLAGRWVFSYLTNGYRKTRLNLATLSGQSLRFRFRVGTMNNSVATPGWMVDNFSVYSCSNPAGAPVITVQPLPQTALAGTTVGFSVSATGNPALRYQWLWNGRPIAGATISSLSVPNVQWANRGYYSVIVSNDVGTTTSDGALLSIGWGSEVVFTQHPADVTVTEGLTARFAGGAIFVNSYAWEVSTNGGATWTPLSDDATYSGTQTPMLTITGVTPTLHNFQYRLTANNSAPVTSATRAATLKVLPASLITNGDFSNDLSGWTFFDFPTNSGERRVENGVFEWNRPGNSSTQSVVYYVTGREISGTPLQAQFDLGNSSTIRKRVSVLILDSNFSDLSVCTFWLEPGAPMMTYRMRTHTNRPWANAAIYFYAATTGNALATGGYLRLDNVSMSFNPAGSELRTECEDPTSPMPPGGAAGPNLIVNGDFSAGMTAWSTLFTITSQVSDGVFEFIRTAGLPGGVVLQPTGALAASHEFLTATFDLGNSSAVRKRVTLLVHSNDFSDLAACTFWLPAGLPLSTYQMKMQPTKPWAAGGGTGVTFSLYGASVGLDQWMRLDNVRLQRTPGSANAGTECIEPAEILAPLVNVSPDSADRRTSRTRVRTPGNP